MNGSTQAMIERIVNKLKDAWNPEGGADIRDFSRYTVEEVSGQGATSLSYRIRFVARNGASKDFYVKKYIDNTADGLRQLERDFRTGVWLSCELRQHSTVNIATPVLMMPGDGVLITPFVSGKNLSHFFHRKLRWHFISNSDANRLNGIIKDIGAGLVDLQDISVGNKNIFCENVNSENIIRSLNSDLDRFEEFYISQKICSELVINAISLIRQNLSEYFQKSPEYCFQHNDYILQNFILSERGKIHVFDFANSKIGIPYCDMAHLIHSLEDLTYLRTISKSLVDRLKQTFISQIKERKNVDNKMLSAMRAYFQIYSGTIVFNGRRGGMRGGASDFIKVDPEQRLKAKLDELIRGMSLCSGI